MTTKPSNFFQLFKKPIGGTATESSIATVAIVEPEQEKITTDAECLVKSGLFDDAFYQAQVGAVEDCVIHYLANGVSIQAKPHPLFDTKFYIDNNPDVAIAGINPLLHYLNGGADEGRKPHPLFDTEYYLRTNPGIRKAGLNPLEHFVREGAAQKLRPHLLFDTEYYVTKYGAQIKDENPLVYYLTKGAKTTDPHPLFDTAFYLESNPEVLASELAPLEHFLQNGAERKLSPHPRLLYELYAASYPGVVPSKKNVLEHYLTHGVNRPNFGLAQSLTNVIEAELNKPGRAEELFSSLRERGIYLLREHYFRPFVNPSKLPATHWNTQSEMVGIDIDVEKCISKFENDYKKSVIEFRGIFPTHQPDDNYNGFYLLNGMYMAVDAHVYWSMVRQLRPSKIIEVGAGNSTMIAAAAMKLNNKEGSELIVIEPFPDQIVKAGLSSYATVVQSFVEDVDVNLFDSLNAGDILFIDSTHVIRQGGDVLQIYCEILPRLKPGIHVHVHDISLPKPYPRTYLEQGLFWTEQYLLQAFLTNNENTEVTWPGNYLMCKTPERMTDIFPEIAEMRKLYPSSEPSAFWFLTK